MAQGPQRRCGRRQQGRAVVDAHREPGVGGDRGHHVRRHPTHPGGSRHDQVRHHALRAMPGQRPAAQRHGLVQRLHGAQRPERAGAGVVVLHARAVESRDGRRGGGDSLRHGPAPDSHGCGCLAHRRSGAGTGGRRLHARLLRAVARQAVHEPADALRRADERRHLDRVELLPRHARLL
ncbi:hypothetical protein SDC9_172764 [bioreactor metagenome]|uniref:Uncharacterized protein n=1 Tax=bioreactor metagenome TaxID=1076179 RepID=A0A645GF85_9ZZZZ